jgi:hypothetical protein
MCGRGLVDESQHGLQSQSVMEKLDSVGGVRLHSWRVTITSLLREVHPKPGIRNPKVWGGADKLLVA